MGRAPCCDKTGLTKGPWTTEEDLILINYINQNGHGNWRALPKQAGLLRCGKSCRLRWMNYLRPDIKRGNFSREEEETIIKLHAELGNKWSVIAARLPGRTDNEIKNVWHTHLKKRLTGKSQPKSETKIGKFESYSDSDLRVEKYPEPSSPTQSFSETSSVTTTTAAATAAEVGGSDDFNAYMMAESLENLMEMGESFWSEVFSGEDWSGTSNFSSGNGDSQLQSANSFASDLDMKVGNDFWQNVFSRAEGFTELFEF